MPTKGLSRELALCAGRLGEVAGDIRFQNVWFTYPSRPDSPVLRGLSLHLRPGTVTALVGPSGGGKSTVAKLLLRAYDPDPVSNSSSSNLGCGFGGGGGSILLDGVDIRRLDLEWYHRQTALVAQEPTLFRASIRDNLAFVIRTTTAGLDGSTATDRDGMGTASVIGIGSNLGYLELAGDSSVEGAIVEACKMANAHGFISKLPRGYHTDVGEGGLQLSGGQRQRIAIARALAADPRVLVLDEATSALDTESESLVQKALERAMVGRTTLVIAHRLSTIANADWVAVVDQGKVVEQGPPSELLQDENGAYTKLVAEQKRQQKQLTVHF